MLRSSCKSAARYWTLSIVSTLNLESLTHGYGGHRGCLGRIAAEKQENSLVWIQSPTHGLALLRDDPSELAEIDLRIVQVAAVPVDENPMALSNRLDEQLTTELAELTEQKYEVVLPEVDFKSGGETQVKTALHRVREVKSFSHTALELWNALEQRHTERVRQYEGMLSCGIMWCHFPCGLRFLKAVLWTLLRLNCFALYLFAS